MLGDGKTSYDVGKDGDEQSIGGCSVRFPVLLPPIPSVDFFHV